MLTQAAPPFRWCRGQDLADFHAVNVTGTTNVLDAGRSHGMRRVVALSTGTFFV
jgi:nucleoside-diphosphate-sugar epimerase